MERGRDPGRIPVSGHQVSRRPKTTPDQGGLARLWLGGEPHPGAPPGVEREEWPRRRHGGVARRPQTLSVTSSRLTTSGASFPDSGSRFITVNRTILVENSYLKGKSDEILYAPRQFHPFPS